MNKRSVTIITGLVIVAIAIGTIVASKAVLGDSKTHLPGEQATENMLHVQEANDTANVQQSNNAANVQQSNNAATGQVSKNAESTESGP
jgi:hypothetical protein